MNALLNKIETSFKAATKGQESLHNMIWWWGVMGYLIAYFIIDKIIKVNNFIAIDVIISLLATVYFIWHIYALKKCSPKKPKLSKEEKRKMREEARKNFGKSLARKLFLQESITKWDPVFITMVLDLFCIANFLGYVVR